MIMKKLLPFLLFAVALNSYAGDKGNKQSPAARASGDKGNIYNPISYLPQNVEINYYDGYYGGDAIVCRSSGNGQITAATIIDYAEKDKFNRRYTVYEGTITDYKFMGMMAYKLEQAAPDVFSTFRKEAERLSAAFTAYMRGNYKRKDVLFVNKLVQVTDNGNRNAIKVKQKYCKIEQLVIREKKYNGVQYTVNKQIFDKLNPKDRRGLILHEALYHAFNMYYGDTNSAKARFFHRALLQQQVEKLTREKILEYLRQAFIYY
jgi:hypothetical protein